MNQHTSENPARHRQLLRSTLQEFFGFTDDGWLQSVEPELSFVQLVPGETLFRQGDTADGIYFLMQGRLRAVAGESGQFATLGEITRGETVGELGLITGEPRSATVLAVRNSILARMPSAVFEKVFSGRPGIGFGIMRTVIERFRRADRKRRPDLAINVCILPVTDGVDAAGFAERLTAIRAEYVGKTVTVSRDRLAADSVAGKLTAMESEHAGLTLIADPASPEWTQACIAQADEILLLARADASPAVTEIEKRFLDDRQPAPLARRNLILLHDESTRSPLGTAKWLNGRPGARHFHIRPALERDMRRLARILSGRGVGLVLSGGGARGFAHLGVMKALAESGIEIDIVGGVSIGSPMGALCAMDARGDAIRIARRAFVESGGPTTDYNILPMVSLIKGRKGRRVTAQGVHDAAGSYIDIEDTWITYFCIAADYSAAREEVLTRGSLTDSIMASIAIPGAFPPVLLNRHLYVDGGVMNNMPVDVMEGYGVRTIFAVDLMSDYVREFDFERVPGSWTLLFDRFKPRSMRRYRLPSLSEILLNANVLQSMARQKEMRERADLCFHPPLRGIRLLDWMKFDRIVEAGYQQAKEALAQADPARLAAWK